MPATRTGDEERISQDQLDSETIWSRKTSPRASCDSNIRGSSPELKGRLSCYAGIAGAYAGKNEILRWYSRLDGAEAIPGAVLCTWRRREAFPPLALC
jgi:hypothetical protein